MNRLSFNSVFNILETNHGLSLPQPDVEALGMAAWDKINVKSYATYELKIRIEDNQIRLPCNLSEIIGVYGTNEDTTLTSNNKWYPQYTNQWTQDYISRLPQKEKIYHYPGRLLSYRQEHDTLYFKENEIDVALVYKGWLADDDGLPYLNSRQAEAIASYIAYITKWKKALITENGNTANLAGKLELDWHRNCNNARVSEYFSENDMDMILNAKTSWNRKTYNISHKWQ